MATSSAAQARGGCVDAEETLSWIESRVTNIYTASSEKASDDNSPLLSRQEYLEIYAAVFSYCTVSKSPQGKRSASQHRGAHLWGEDIYRALEQQIRSHCAREQSKILGTDWNADVSNRDPEKLILAYLDQWTKLLHVAAFMSRLFSFLERHWIKREQDEKGGNVPYGLRDLHMIMWKEEVLNIRQLPFSTQLPSPGAPETPSKLLNVAARLPQNSAKHRELIDRFIETLTAINRVYVEPKPRKKEKETVGQA